VREAERRKVGTMKRKVVKGWAVFEDGYFLRAEAEPVVMKFPIPKVDSHYHFLPCTISYELPRKARKAK